MNIMKRSLLELFVDTGAFKTASPGEPFTLASGKKSNYYIDCRQVLLRPASSRLAVISMTRLIIDYMEYAGKRDNNISLGSIGVGGLLLLGGIIHNAPAQVNGFVVRDTQKDHGTRQTVEGQISEDSVVILVDDVLTTGGSLLKACTVLHEVHGIKPQAVIVLVDREEGGAEMLKSAMGCEVRSFIKLSDFKADKSIVTM